MNEYLLVLYFSSGDEIHMDLLEYKHYERIEELLEKTSFRRATSEEYEELVSIIYDNRVEHLFCQSYVLEDYPFAKYKIKKVIHIPEAGC